MDWGDILRDRVLPHMHAAALGEAFIQSLEKTKEGEILGRCLAIDVAAGALKPPLLASLFDHLQPHFNDPREAFGWVLETHPLRNELVCASSFSTSSAQDPYVRVLTLADFVTYYMTPTYARSLDASDIEDVRSSLKSRVRKLGDIKAAWSGHRDIVWVVPSHEIDALTEGHRAKDFVSILADVLGLSRKPSLPPATKPELVLVHYPDSFTVRCWQPTALDASWDATPRYYLSFFAYDYWGRTHSCSGGRNSCRERIHRGFSPLTDSFTALYLGEASDLGHDLDALLNDARERLLQAVAAQRKAV